MSPRGPLAAMVAQVRRHRLIEEGDRVLLGLGGGVASAGLLAGFIMGREFGLPRCELAVASVEWDLDEDHDGAEVVAEVGRVTRSFGLPFFAVRPARARGAVKVIAELRALAKAEGFQRVAVATTRDDELRRVIRGMSAGTGLDGLRGFSARGGAGLVRPMLTLREVEAASLARDLGIEPVQLPPDRQPLPLSVESTVLPRWRALEPGLDESLLAIARETRALRRHIRAEARARLERARTDDGRLHFALSQGEVMSAPLASELSGLILAEAGVAASGLRSACSNRLARFFRRPRAEAGRGRATPTLVLPGIQAEASLTDGGVVVRVNFAPRGSTQRAGG